MTLIATLFSWNKKTKKVNNGNISRDITISEPNYFIEFDKNEKVIDFFSVEISEKGQYNWTYILDNSSYF